MPRRRYGGQLETGDGEWQEYLQWCEVNRLDPDDQEVMASYEAWYADYHGEE